MKQKIRIWLRNFFGFSRTETNGFIILLLLMIIVLAMPFISRSLYSFYQLPVQSQKDKANLESLLSELEKNIEKKKETAKKQKYKTFDLNKSQAHHLVEAGFPKYLAERIVKYRKKVSPFTSKKELMEIYGIDSAFYKQVYPYMTVSKPTASYNPEIEKTNFKNDQSPEEKIKPEKFKKTTNLQMDINKADSFQLQKVYGIGPTFSKRIIKYREYLGGFHSTKQLEEVYGLKQENLDSLKRHIYLTKNLNLRQIKVNQLSADSLVQHPYISYKEANLLVNFRKQHGPFKSVSGLQSIKILDSAWVEKVKPYISFE
jgi:DNA uptake protein ComE-like DNA-binding protein